jgi:hypothetical protein
VDGNRVYAEREQRLTERGIADLDAREKAAAKKKLADAREKAERSAAYGLL